MIYSLTEEKRLAGSGDTRHYNQLQLLGRLNQEDYKVKVSLG